TASTVATATNEGTRRRDHSAAPAPTRARVASAPNGAIGAAAARVATPATHVRTSRVGKCTSAASGGTRPATGPALRPHIISGPAAGTASTFAGSETSGTEPNVGTSTTAAPTCAAIDAANTVGTRRRNSGGVNTTRPVHAATDRRNPTLRTSSGSTSR